MILPRMHKSNHKDAAPTVVKNNLNHECLKTYNYLKIMIYSFKFQNYHQELTFDDSIAHLVEGGRNIFR